MMKTELFTIGGLRTTILGRGVAADYTAGDIFYLSSVYNELIK
jgi:hypothetical protein